MNSDFKLCRCILLVVIPAYIEHVHSLKDLVDMVGGPVHVSIYT